MSRPAMVSTLAEVGLMLAETKALVAKLQVHVLCGRVAEDATHRRIRAECRVQFRAGPAHRPLRRRHPAHQSCIRPLCPAEGLAPAGSTVSAATGSVLKRIAR